MLNNLLCQVAPFNDEDLAMADFSFQKFKPREFIFTVDDSPRDIYFILEGLGRYFYVTEHGKEVNKALVNSGDAFASIRSLVEGVQSPFYTQAISNLTIASISYDDLIQLAERSRHWNLFLRKSYENLVIEKEMREASFLLLSAKERYEEFLQQFGTDADQFPLNQIAMYLGITDVSLSRIRRKMNLT